MRNASFGRASLLLACISATASSASGQAAIRPAARAPLQPAWTPVGAFARGPGSQVPATGGLGCLVQEVKLLPDDAMSSSNFGSAVSLDGDTALVGSPWYDSGIGAAYFFLRQGSTWTQGERLAPATQVSLFGGATVLVGDTALVGALFDDGNAPGCGSVYVFVREGGTWNLQTRLLADDGDTNDLFGCSIAFEGDTAVVGAAGGLHPTHGEGAAYVFVRAGTSWTQQAKLVSHDVQFQDYFGQDVAFRGDTALVGAYGHDVTTVSDGAAYVFVRTGTTWVEQAKLQSPHPGHSDYFGWSVALTDDTALVGATRDDDVAQDAGAVYAFVRAGDSWTLQQKLTTNVAQHSDQFGMSLCVSGERLIVGASNSHAHGERPGAAYVFERKGSSWVERVELLADDGLHMDRFGAAVALDGDTVLVGAPNDDDDGTSSGSAYVSVLASEVGAAYCTCPAGPCGNPDPDAGCANSTGVGATLRAQGTTDPDELNFHVSGGRPGQFGIFIQGDNAVMLTFGDGFRCAGGSLVRITPLPEQIATDGSVGYGPCHGDPLVSDTTGVVPGSGDTKRYQFWYRDPTGPCGDGFNLSNGLEIVW